MTPSPTHLLSLIFLLFVTHWHSEPTVLHPLGPCGMKRVMTLPYRFPWDLVITGCFPKKSNTDSPLSYHQHHQACQLPIKRGPATVNRHIDPGNSTSSRPPPAMPDSRLHWESELLSNARGPLGSSPTLYSSMTNPGQLHHPPSLALTSWTSEKNCADLAHPCAVGIYLASICLCGLVGWKKSP